MAARHRHRKPKPARRDRAPGTLPRAVTRQPNPSTPATASAHDRVAPCHLNKHLRRQCLFAALLTMTDLLRDTDLAVAIDILKPRCVSDAWLLFVTSLP